MQTINWLLGRSSPGPTLGFRVNSSTVEVVSPQQFIDILKEQRLFHWPYVVDGDLDLSFSSDLACLLPPDLDLWVKGNLNLAGCKFLKSLPKKLRVDGDLCLRSCWKLRELPEDLQVGGSLELLWCYSLRILPNRLQVGGIINLSNCELLTALPNTITKVGPTVSGEERLIYLGGSGLSDELVERLARDESFGILFVTEKKARLPAAHFTSLEEAIKFWNALLPIKWQVTQLSLNLRQDRVRHVMMFFETLQAAKEYQNVATKPTLAMRVLDVVKEMGDNDKFKKRACQIIYRRYTSSQISSSRTLDELELVMQINAAMRMGVNKGLRNLGKGILLLEEVKKAARLYARTLYWADGIEVLLTFQVGLRDRFQLPLPRGLVLFKANLINEVEIQRIGDEIELSVTEEKVNNYLATWGPWKNRQGRKGL